MSVTSIISSGAQHYRSSHKNSTQWWIFQKSVPWSSERAGELLTQLDFWILTLTPAFIWYFQESNWILRSMGFKKQTNKQTQNQPKQKIKTKPQETSTKIKNKNKTKIFLPMHSRGCLWAKHMLHVYYCIGSFACPQFKSPSNTMHYAN